MLHDQVAIVTGASRGIGRATALKLAGQGARLIVNGTNAQLLQALVNEISEAGGTADWVAGDVADEQTALQAVERARETFGRIDVLVNNAGINNRAPTLDMAFADWQRVIDVNLNGTLHFCRAVLPSMIEQQAGSIVNVSSVAAKMAHRNAAPAYGASKAAVNYLTIHLAREMAPHNIRVNAICPGPIETDMTEQWHDDYRREVLASVPLGKLGTPEQMADTVLFLASPMSGYVTGATLDANGGTYMR